tara:strand:- start:210 stop:527 length:318 start_codon:yes stop_codon:yes gene_type:complete
MDTIFARLEENQARASELREELARSINAKAALPWLFRKGTFALKVIGRSTPFAHSKNLRNLPYKASVVYKDSETEIPLDYSEWCVLSRQYFSPDVHAGIKKYWES